MISCVIFDMDGVLVDSYRAHFEAWREVAASAGFALGEAEFVRTFGQTSREIIRQHWPMENLDDPAIRSIDDRKEAAFRRIIARNVPVMDGARELIEDLRSAGSRIAVGSSAPLENLEVVLRAFGGPGQFDAVVTGRDVIRGKPDPQVFLLAAERVGVEARHCAVIEDAPPGIEAATRAGMASVALVSTGRTEDDFDSVHPDLVVRSLRDLTPSGLHALILARLAGSTTMPTRAVRAPR